MYTFLSGIILLILGYFAPGKFLSRTLKTDSNRLYPACTMQDRVDFVSIPT